MSDHASAPHRITNGTSATATRCPQLQHSRVQLVGAAIARASGRPLVAAAVPTRDHRRDRGGLACRKLRTDRDQQKQWQGGLAPDWAKDSFQIAKGRRLRPTLRALVGWPLRPVREVCQNGHCRRGPSVEQSRRATGVLAEQRLAKTIDPRPPKPLKEWALLKPPMHKSRASARVDDRKIHARAYHVENRFISGADTLPSGLAPDNPGPIGRCA